MLNELQKNGTKTCRRNLGTIKTAQKFENDRRFLVTNGGLSPGEYYDREERNISKHVSFIIAFLLGVLRS